MNNRCGQKLDGLVGYDRGRNQTNPDGYHAFCHGRRLVTLRNVRGTNIAIT